jgi:hypothetical protein
MTLRAAIPGVVGRAAKIAKTTLTARLKVIIRALGPRRPAVITNTRVTRLSRRHRARTRGRKERRRSRETKRAIEKRERRARGGRCGWAHTLHHGIRRPGINRGKSMQVARIHASSNGNSILQCLRVVVKEPGLQRRR